MSMSMSGTPEDEAYMRQALAEAREAGTRGDVPVGAVLVRAGLILGRAGNRREADADPTAHAEVIALRQAARGLGTWYLCDAVLYVTQEPCPMCAGALVNARVARVVYGCENPKAGAVRTLYRLLEDERLNHRAQVQTGVLAEDCAILLRQFFEKLRERT